MNINTRKVSEKHGSSKDSVYTVIHKLKMYRYFREKHYKRGGPGATAITTKMGSGTIVQILVCILHNVNNLKKGINTSLLIQKPVNRGSLALVEGKLNFYQPLLRLKN